MLNLNFGKNNHPITETYQYFLYRVYLAMSDVHTLRTLFFVGDFSAVLNLISRKTLTPEPGSEDEEIATLKWRSLIA